MNKTNLKRYAPQARRDFIAAVTGRAQLLGLSERAGQVQAEPCTVQGDVALIAGRPWPASVQGQRQALIERMQRDGYPGTCSATPKAAACPKCWPTRSTWPKPATCPG